MGCFSLADSLDGPRVSLFFLAARPQRTRVAWTWAFTVQRLLFHSPRVGIFNAKGLLQARLFRRGRDSPETSQTVYTYDLAFPFELEFTEGDKIVLRGEDRNEILR